MKFPTQLKPFGFLILLFIIGVTVSFSGIAEWLTSTATGTTVTASNEQTVEYGASLSDWEAAVKPNAPVADSQAADSQDADSQIADSQVTGEEAASETLQEKEWPIASNSTSDAQNAAPATGDNTASSADSDEAPLDQGSPTSDEPSEEVTFTFENVTYREILWDGLIPANFTAESIMSKYEDQLAEIEDGSPEAAELYETMQAEFNNAPINDELDEALIRLPGFIAPLEYTDELITEFLLVPYFGACIHVPAPPANQTVLVKANEGQGIKTEDSFGPIWVMGKITTEETSTELASAGYFIEDAFIELYTPPTQ